MRFLRYNTSEGFTLLETMIVVTIVGILSAIASPTWLSFRDKHLLNAARSEALAAMRQAQTQAIQKRTKWQTSFRELDGRVQWATHPVSIADLSFANWHDLPQGVRLDPETTLQRVKGVRRVQFDYLGQVNGQLGRVTFSTQHSGKNKRCVVVSTLLGALRSGENRAEKDGDKTCW